jgi:PPK2 family polyphosphate:nucleotide phosphotransferase
VPFDGSFSVKKARTVAKDVPLEDECRHLLQAHVERVDKLQRRLYACNRHSMLLIFQAMDAAGKDSTIRAVLTGVNPAAFQVSAFVPPSTGELDHDFLWRTTIRLPERGRIGVFNRSYYEEVLVVRVHPELLDYQRLPKAVRTKHIWTRRLESIGDHERHLARNGCAIVKFWLNVSRDEQKRRLLSRIDRKKKNWKFSEQDVEERDYWDDYMNAYEKALNATSREWAPWYAIPADNKPHMRTLVGGIIADSLDSLDLEYPKPGAEQLAGLEKARERLEND